MRKGQKGLEAGECSRFIVVKEGAGEGVGSEGGSVFSGEGRRMGFIREGEGLDARRQISDAQIADSAWRLGDRLDKRARGWNKPHRGRKVLSLQHMLPKKLKSS